MHKIYEGHVVLEICSPTYRQVDTQTHTHRQTDILITILRSFREGGIITITIDLHSDLCMTTMCHL